MDDRFNAGGNCHVLASARKQASVQATTTTPCCIPPRTMRACYDKGVTVPILGQRLHLVPRVGFENLEPRLDEVVGEGVRARGRSVGAK